MGSCRSGRLRRLWWPNKRGASLGGHGLTPEGKINGIIISRNNKATFSRNNIWVEVKVPWWGESSFFTPPLHPKQSGFFGCQWSVVLFGYGRAEEMKPEGRLKGKGSNCPKPANCVPWFFCFRQDVCYWVFFSLIFLPDRFRSNMNKYVLLCKTEAERCWFAVILLVPLFFLDITSCPLCPVFLVLVSKRLSLMAIGSHLG